MEIIKLQIAASDYAGSKEAVLGVIMDGIYDKEDAIRRSLLVSNFTVKIPLIPFYLEEDIDNNYGFISILCRGIELEKERRLFKTLEKISGKPLKDLGLYMEESKYDDDPEGTIYVGITYTS